MKTKDEKKNGCVLLFKGYLNILLRNLLSPRATAHALMEDAGTLINQVLGEGPPWFKLMV